MRKGNPSVGNGVYRSDYHRRNRRENKSMHKHSFGLNVPLSQTEFRFMVQPLPDRDELIRLARLSWHKEHDEDWREKQEWRGVASVDRMCVVYVRHHLTNWHQLTLRSKKIGSERYLVMAREIFSMIAEAYPWLKGECEWQYGYRERMAARKVAVIKGCKSLSETQQSEDVEDFNDSQCSAPFEPMTEDEETAAYFTSLPSLYQTRFIYLPPFLKPEEIRAKRFIGSDMNDRWWEWEKDMSFTDWRGRLNDTRRRVHE